MYRHKDKSINISRIQCQLRRLGLYKGNITGFFDLYTDDAVRTFQRSNKLQADGIAGPMTRQALDNATKNAWLVLFLHTSATPEGRNDKADQILLNHLLPAKINNTEVLFMGKRVSAASVVGKKINLTRSTYTITGRELSGRGWSRPGYSDIFELDGKVINIRDWNQDNLVNEWEVTFGIHGSILMNNNSLHSCYIGGMNRNLTAPKDTRTKEQLQSMETYVRFCILRNPDIVIAGHDQVQNKACPCFDVPNWLRSIGVKEFNIANWGKLYK